MNHQFSKFFVSAALFSVLFLTKPLLAKPLRFFQIQGFHSCSESTPFGVEKFLALAAHRDDAIMYFGCFDGGFIEHVEDWTEHFYIYTIDSRGHWSGGEEMNPYTAPLELARDLSLSLINTQSEANVDEGMDVIIAGHSHGGWMAMRLAHHLGLSPRFTIHHLLTIDPISYQLCPSSWFPLHALSTTFRWWGEPNDCHKAPRDLESIGESIARAVSNRWTNVYQVSMPYVSSGPIQHATRNLTYQAQTTRQWLSAHGASLRDPRSWQFFDLDLEALFK